MEKQTFRKLFEKACCEESIGGNAGPDCLGVNIIIDGEGNIEGFSNYPKDYECFYQAVVRVNYSKFFPVMRKRWGAEGLLKKMISTIFERPVKYIDGIFLREDSNYALAEVGVDIEKVKEKIASQFKQIGYKVDIEKELCAKA